MVPQVVVFTLLTYLGFASLHRFPALKNDLFPILTKAIRDGESPDGIPLRKSFTGNRGVDTLLAALTSFFTALLDGSDEAEATKWFTVWFLPQCSAVLAFWYWEAGRATYSPLRRYIFVISRIKYISNRIHSPLLFGLVGQLFGIGFAVPLVYLLDILVVPIPPTSLPRSALVRAKTLLPAIFLGLIAPSVVMLFIPASLPTKQLIAAIWQPFPLFVSVVHAVHRVIHPATWTSDTKAKLSVSEATVAFETLKRTYYISALMSAAVHLWVLVPSLISPTPHLSFKNIFLPFYTHAYISGSSIPTEVTYRHIVRLFLHHDFLSMVISSFVFFGWSHYISQSATPTVGRPKSSIGKWLLSMLIISVLASPGAAIAWAAVQREERVLMTVELTGVGKKE